MNRIEFMTRLEVLLGDLTEDERNDALSFYHNYFDDAGSDEEASVLQELGTPEEVANQIKESLGCVNDGKTTSEDTRVEAEVEKEQDTKKKDVNVWKIIAITLLLLIGWPLIIVVAVMWLVISILFDVFTILVAISGVLVFVAGIVLFCIGIAKLFVSPLTGLLFCLAGVVVSALGIIVAIVMAKLAVKTVPVLIRRTIETIRKPFHRKEK